MGTKGKSLQERRRAVVPRALGQFAGEISAESGSGARLTDADGRSYIDFAGGIGVLNAGHCPPPVVEAIQRQAEKLLHASFHVATYEPYLDLCEKLADLFPHGEHTKVVLMNAGAEAVENAIKFARQYTGRPAVLCFSEAFHGRTMMALTLTSKTRYKKGCGPFASEVYRIPYPNHFRYGRDLSEEAFVTKELERLEASFLSVVPADQVAAIIMEPVQGEGGFSVAPKAYLEGMRRICDKHGIMLIFDEVQSGFCRTGRWAAYEHAGVTPDLSTWAKSMGSGLPISAVVGRAEVMDAAGPSTIGGTYGGNPVACAAALATIKLMEDQDLNGRARAMGQVIRDRFLDIKARSPLVSDVRGLGAMLAMEFCHDRDPANPAPDVCQAVIASCRERGVIVLPSGTYANVVRILAPLVISDEDLKAGLDAIDDAVMALGIGQVALA